MATYPSSRWDAGPHGLFSRQPRFCSEIWESLLRHFPKSTKDFGLGAWGGWRLEGAMGEGPPGQHTPLWRLGEGAGAGGLGAQQWDSEWCENQSSETETALQDGGLRPSTSSHRWQRQLGGEGEMRDIETEFPGYPLNHKGVYKGEYMSVKYECIWVCAWQSWESWFRTSRNSVHM